MQLTATGFGLLGHHAIRIAETNSCAAWCGYWILHQEQPTWSRFEMIFLASWFLWLYLLKNKNCLSQSTLKFWRSATFDKCHEYLCVFGLEVGTWEAFLCTNPCYTKSWCLMRSPVATWRIWCLNWESFILNLVLKRQKWCHSYGVGLFLAKIIENPCRFIQRLAEVAW